MDRKPLMRLGLNRMARKLRREGKADDAKLIEQAVRDGKLFEVVSNECECCYAESMQGGRGGALTDFLDWLLAHQEDILAFIKMIMDLFMDVGPSEEPALA